MHPSKGGMGYLQSIPVLAMLRVNTCRQWDSPRSENSLSRILSGPTCSLTAANTIDIASVGLTVSSCLKVAELLSKSTH